MKKDIKKIWLKALRSGEYKKSKSMLHNCKTGGFCCLGVLTDLYRKRVAKKSHDKFWKEREGRYAVCDTDGTYESLYLPEKVQKWSGINNCSGRISDPHDNSLAAINDISVDFKRVIDAIEDYL